MRGGGRRAAGGGVPKWREVWRKRGDMGGFMSLLVSCHDLSLLLFWRLRKGNGGEKVRERWYCVLFPSYCGPESISDTRISRFV